MTAASPTPLRLKSIIAGLWTGNLFASFLLSGVAAMLPAIGLSLSASAAALSLVMVCYNLGQTLSHVISGRICDIFGVKRVLMFGMGIFCVLGLFLGLAPNMPMAIIFRFAQGMAAATISCCVTALAVSVAPSDKRGMVISIVMTAVYVGLAVGPLACGGLTELVSWRVVFFLVALMGVAEILLLHRVLPKDEAPAHRRRIDVPGFLLVAAALASITLGATCTFIHPAVVLLLPLGCVLMFFSIRREWNSEDPMLDLKVLAKVPGLPAGMAATFINFGAFMGLSIFFSLYLQQVLGLNAFHAGCVLMVQSVAQTFVGPLGGRLADRFDPMFISSLGMVLCGVAVLLLMTLDAHSPVWVVVLFQALLGAGAALFVAPNMSATLGGVPKEFMPVASGLMGCLRTLGGLTSNTVMSCTIGLFLGTAAVGPDTADLFMFAMRCVFMLFGLMSFTAAGIGFRAFLRASGR